ncbi:sugar kinase [Pelagibacterium montanilacus]|uniref:sugar kinase n=1 Tax=Pelagibacterium montanilacus TaxID=2185280 RepID=UPI000F8E1525|nr:sugar kinase [Pelagibacterium montanilacus]
MGTIVSIGECMIELSGGADGQYRLGYAGDTFNTAYYMAARLPEPWDVQYLTCVGDDLYSDRMVAHIAGNGVGTRHIARLQGHKPGLYLIHQADGDRHFTYWRETSAARRLADDPARLKAGLAQADLIYFSGITLAILEPAARSRLIEAIARRRADGARVGFDPNIRPVLWPDTEALREALMAAARVSSIVLPTHGDELPYFGDADARATSERYLRAGAEEVVVKNGGEPALVATAQGAERVPATRVQSVVDATGAGDSFGGAYIAARLTGASPAEAARAGHEVASIVIGHHGALAPREALGAAQ